MKIALISNYQPDGSDSMLRYGRILQSQLEGRGHTVVLVQPPAIVGRLPFRAGTLAKWIGYIDKYLMAPPYLRWKTRGADVVHVCDHSNAMYLRCAGSKPRLVTCHDVIAIRGARGDYPAVQVGLMGRMQQRWIFSSLRRAPYVICVSWKTANDLRTLLPHTKSTFRVIHHSPHRTFSPASSNQIERALSSVGWERHAEYLLHLGGNQWYKNRLGALRIFAELKKYPAFHQTGLILAGTPWAKGIRDFCRSAGLTDSVLEARKVSDGDLRALYSGARALLFPSLEEGFGWPILEAQACGCPVITSNRAPMTEIAGEAAIFIDPTEPGLAAKTIAEAWPRLRQVREAGFRNIERFAEEKVVDAYCAAYEEIAADGRPSARAGVSL